jgi:hypothetical protein
METYTFFNTFPQDVVGRNYLQEAIGPIIHKVVISDQKYTYEIDATKCQKGEAEVPKNLQRFTERTKFTVDTIISPKVVDTMPSEIRYIISLLLITRNSFLTISPAESLLVIMQS